MLFLPNFDTEDAGNSVDMPVDDLGLVNVLLLFLLFLRVQHQLRQFETIIDKGVESLRGALGDSRWISSFFYDCQPIVIEILGID